LDFPPPTFIVSEPMPIFYRLLAISAVVLGMAGTLPAAPGDQAKFFENRVRPLMAEKCQSCHGREKQQASLRLDSKMGVLSGGENGPAVIAGQVDQSMIIQAVRREGLEMPPDEPLTEDEIAVFEKWVRDGAYWPQETASMESIALGDQDAIRKQGSKHWSFQPISHPQPPTVGDSFDVRNPIDAFIAATLSERKLDPLPDTDKQTLVRRAYFDVTGLPPPLKVADGFISSSDPKAYEQIVDNLLASKEYGQRWGRYWLDLARYADTRDWMAQTDERYPFAYTYRDYVIRSINEDKPYDQFIREQLAADLISQDEHSPILAALGFLTVGPRFRNDINEQIADRVDSVTRGLMGLTVACARCHDHKYDPITIEDFYALYGVFGSTDLTEDYPTIEAGKKVSADQRQAYEEARAAKVKEKEEFIDKLRKDAIADIEKNLQTYMLAAYETGVGNTIDIRGAISKYKTEEPGTVGLEDSLTRISRDKTLLRHKVYGPLHYGLTLDDKNFSERYANWLTKASEAKYDQRIVEALSTKPIANRRQFIERYAEIFNAALSGEKKGVTDSKTLAEVLREPKGLLDLAPNSVVAGFRVLGTGRKKMGELDTAIREIDAVHPGSPPRAMVVAEREQPITPFVFLRGDSSRRGDRVSRRYISYFEKGEPQPFSKDNSGRLDLAEKIVSPDNPLTARVAVNRVWMRYFGTGLVDSPDDFGLRSNPPSHPELLDWLASQLIDNGWSMKWLHRTILTSSAYRRTSVVPKNFIANELDPENHYLWRQNRRRLDFEATRDTMLAVSGELDRSLDGHSVKLSEQPYSLRRTVYAYVDRVELDPMLRVFDFASPLASAANRAKTTIPQHALFVMNHPFVIERVQTIADKVRPAESDKDSVMRGINAIFRRMLGRIPTTAERAAAFQFLTTPVSTEGLKRASPWTYVMLPIDESDKPSFIEFPFWTGQAYQVGPDFPDPKYGFARLTNTGGHPGNTRYEVVRRFNVAASGEAKVTGLLKHARENGDGVVARIVLRRSDGSFEQIEKTWKAFNSEQETNTKSFGVKAGDIIDCIVGCGKTPTADAYIWTVDISIEFDGESFTTWSSRDGFKPPPPPMLDGWEQLAQALMLTNEFIYID
jgi:hypothetical protein